LGAASGSFAPVNHPPLLPCKPVLQRAAPSFEPHIRPPTLVANLKEHCVGVNVGKVCLLCQFDVLDPLCELSCCLSGFARQKR